MNRLTALPRTAEEITGVEGCTYFGGGGWSYTPEMDALARRGEHIVIKAYKSYYYQYHGGFPRLVSIGRRNGSRISRKEDFGHGAKLLRLGAQKALVVRFRPSEYSGLAREIAFCWKKTVATDG